MIKKIILSLMLILNILISIGCTANDYEQIDGYQIILDKYREAESSKYKEYDKNYVDGLEVFANLDNKPCYALYDIDKNGVSELFIGTGEGSIINIWALKNDKPIRLFSN